ncbi:efflux RND transporter periplasmic adaptor subunit [Aquisalimonas lutea]|uniref:efflux RND transporter periplasmic adaptor subunit n=1 Tax=Aquisalimonas lutea TaxID=1327750 RepID=UPI0025B42E73|nr:efflux RND transporter periplasmic adaptor subunit [Aquisalimonas lutea]MDN3515984.1 efflux RND transporter periplasmic adaptor subunit [Aquisalimonas lutea]
MFESQGRARRRAARGAVLVVVAAALAACGSEQGSGGQGGPAGPGGGGPAPVTVITAEAGSVDVEQQYAGRVRGSREVEVRNRVEGVLEERLYREGQIVEQGEAMFRIDSEPFEVAVRAAEAELATVQADLAQARREWERTSRLYERNAVSERERDQARSALELARAQVAVAEARVEQAQLDLDYTEVKAPVSGVTSLEARPEGSLLEQGALLSTIVQQDPVHVRFALPESDAAIQRTAREAMRDGGDGDHKREARVILPDGSEYERTGVIDFTASTIDSSTGTVLARAVFDNPDDVLIPGQFVRVRVLLRTLDDVIVVPEKAVGSGPEGPQVYLVGDDSTARSRPVELGPVTPEGQVILDGLEPGDRVVVNGLAGLRDGAEVDADRADDGGGE